MSRLLLDAYRQALGADGLSVHEEIADFSGMSELEVQARWFSGSLGRDWISSNGETVYIEDFGRWNREPGPDFADARVRIGDAVHRGPIELDFDVRDWERHGHIRNPAFRDTVLHLFVQAPAQRFFTRTLDNREVTQVRIAAPSTAPRKESAEAALITADSARIRRILEAAARHRLDIKARAIERHAAVHGEEEAWFAAIAVALGYKSNQLPFLLLAQRVGLKLSSGTDGEAMLFGASGFLESPEPPAAGPEVRTYLRGLWELWWKLRARCERWILPSDAWVLAPVRPANHPHRRVAAMAGIAASWNRIHAALAAGKSSDLAAALDALDHPFWSHRFNLGAASLKNSQALLGSQRIRDIVLNVCHPLAVDRDPAAWEDFLETRGPAPAAIMTGAAARFFGTGAPSLLKYAFAQQGLLQLERDFRSAEAPDAFLQALGRFPLADAPGRS
jgi:hypothetical protein